ncbi:MAG: DUF1559 domain-containing protein [Thermoguttaceae bacterium]|nr:DUF1559 domain-containing protein [Thermoguttaceae bacterium]MDW8038651.1 DUF1559 domain-containing protein [Thermoguttaceae bacterium]
MGKALFYIQCMTCQARLAVRDPAAIGNILLCPKCQSFVEVVAPPGWKEKELELSSSSAQEPVKQPEIPAPSATPSPTRELGAVGKEYPISEGAGSPPLASSPLRREEKGGPKRDEPLCETPAGPSTAPPPASPKGALLGGIARLPSQSHPSGGTSSSPMAGEIIPPPVIWHPSKVLARRTLITAEGFAEGGAQSFLGEKTSPTPSPETPSDSQQKSPLPEQKLTEVSHGRFFALWGWAIPRWCPLWLVMSIASVAGMLFGIGLLSLFRTLPSGSEPPAASPIQPPPRDQAAEEASSGATAPVASKKPPKKLDKQWIPDPTGLVVAIRGHRLLPQGGLVKVMESFCPKAAGVLEQLLNHLNLAPEKVEHVLWFAVDGADWPNQAIILVAVADHPETAPLGELSQRGQSCGFRVGQGECRKDPSSGWPHPFAVVSAQWVLTGPELLLRHLSERPRPQLSRPALERMIDSWPWEADLAVGVDWSWFRSLIGSNFQRLAAVWPDSHRTLQILWELPEGLSSQVYLGQPVRWEIGLWCRTVSEAEQVRAAAQELLSSANAGLNGRLQRLMGEIQAGRWKADQAAEYEKLLKLLQVGVQSGRVELVEAVVWARTSWKQPYQEMLGTVHSAKDAMHRDWQEAVCDLIQQREQRLLEALAAYSKAEGHFPPGAEGGPLWDPATRLSWIALVLPYMGRADWYHHLQLRYAWNSPQNKPVAQRSLEEVLNPAIPERTTPVGFPVTHYVGMGGVGEDAVQPQADQRRIGVFGFGRTLKPEEITDGLSYTIAIAGVSSRLGPWASGGSATVRPFSQPPYVNGPDGFGTGQPDGMFVGMADGSVRFISKNVDPQVVEMLATARGMERIEGLAWEVGPKPIRPGSAPDGPTSHLPASKLAGGPSISGTSKTAAAEGHPLDPIKAKPSPLTPTPQPPPSKSASESPSATPLPIAEQPAPAPKQPGIEKEQLVSRQQLQAATEARLAEKVLSIDLPGLPLHKAVGLVEALSGVRVTYDLEEMELAGVSLDRPVQLKQTNLSLGEILRKILDPLRLVYLVEGQDVVISRPPAARQQWYTVRYEVSDLVGSEEIPAEQIAKLLERFVMPESWQTSGGNGKIEVQEDVLLIHQTELAHRRAAELLERLRLARRLPLRIDPNRKDLSLETRLSQMRTVLSRPITASFGSPTPLPEILAYLEQLGQVVIVVDWVSLRAEGHQPPLPATVRANQQPLADVLTSLLEPLGLTWRIAGPELLQITTQNAARMRLEVEFYPVAEAIAALGSPQALLEAIKDQVGRGSWEDSQGPGTLYFDAPSQYLIVLQTQSVHRELERFLASLQAPKPATK